jgi:hypothetical protein
MNKIEFIKALKKVGPVFVWVNLYGADGEYVQANKTHLLELAENSPEDSRFEAVLRAGGLHIN